MASEGEDKRGGNGSVSVRWIGEDLWIDDAAWPVTVGHGETLADAVRRTLIALDITLDELAFDNTNDERRFRHAVGEE
jgi:hypothetical protein